jgi:DNA-binding response OmpR family regulator
MEGKKILVVDDEEYIRELIKDFLKIKGIQCDGAGDPDSAIRLMEQSRYDLILLDRNLENRTAEEMVDDIRKVVGATPVLLITGDQGLSEKYVREMGMDGVVHKPFQIEVFFETVEKYLEQA